MSILRRKWFVMAAIALSVLAPLGYRASAATYTLDAVKDGGLYPGQLEFVQFVDSSTGAVLRTITSSTPQFHNMTDVFNAASGLTNWTLQSAGSIWDGPGITRIGIGVSLGAGTWRIRPYLDSDPKYTAFSYDMFDSTNDSYNYNKYVWFLNVQSFYMDGPTPVVDYLTLGSDSRKTTAIDAYNNIKNSYLDITLANAGYLTFWIWDNNTTDNAGGIAFQIGAVPLPSSLLLLLSGVPFLVSGIRRRITG